MKYLVRILGGVAVVGTSMLCTMEIERFVTLIEDLSACDAPALMATADQKTKKHLLERFCELDQKLFAITCMFDTTEVSKATQESPYQKRLKDAYRAAARLSDMVEQMQQQTVPFGTAETIYRKKIKNTGLVVSTTCTQEIQNKLLEIHTKNPQLFTKIAQRIVEQKENIWYGSGYDQALRDVVKLCGVGTLIYVTLRAFR